MLHHPDDDHVDMCVILFFIFILTHLNIFCRLHSTHRTTPSSVLLAMASSSCFATVKATWNSLPYRRQKGRRTTCVKPGSQTNVLSLVLTLDACCSLSQANWSMNSTCLVCPTTAWRLRGESWAVSPLPTVHFLGITHTHDYVRSLLP